MEGSGLSDMDTTTPEVPPKQQKPQLPVKQKTNSSKAATIKPTDVLDPAGFEVNIQEAPKTCPEKPKTTLTLEDIDLNETVTI